MSRILSARLKAVNRICLSLCVCYWFGGGLLQGSLTVVCPVSDGLPDVCEHHLLQEGVV